jgi:hypothetical protein
MAVAVFTGPYIGKPDDQSWVGPMTAYQGQMQAALDNLPATPMPWAWLANNRSILQRNIAFLNDCLSKRSIRSGALQAFATAQNSTLKLNIEWTAETQVHHWVDVFAGWKH